ncbi:MAG: CoA transferase [Actinobacteria bacterium]|nr:CoA transferase [Actinomycetota bacterium]
MAERQRALAGLKVLDLATLLAGPFAGSILGEHGADVVKVEQPGVGDPLRRLGTASPTGDTYWWFTDTRNKQMIEVDLRTDEGVGEIKALVAEADVVIENFRTGTMARWGLGYDDLVVVNSGLVQLSVTGYGQTGPLANTAGVARIAEAFTGMTHLTGQPDGPPGLGGSSALADYICGLYGALGVMLAISARHETGRGQQIDMALYDGVARFLDELVPVYTHTGQGRERMGSETNRSVPHNNYEAADGRWVTIACTNDPLFARLAGVMERPEFLDDDRYATSAARIARRHEVNGIVADWVAKHDAAEVVALCARATVPCGVVNTVAEYVAHPQVEARHSTVTIDVPGLGELTVPGVVPALSDTPGRVDRLGGVQNETSAAAIVARWQK